MHNRIPSSVIGVISEVFNQFYSHSDIDRHFAYADAPGEPPEGNKVKKTMEWLRRTNKQTDTPLEVLGSLLEDIMEREIPEYGSGWQVGPEWVERHRNFKDQISSSLAKAGLAYSPGGHISTASATPTASLREIIERGGCRLSSWKWKGRGSRLKVIQTLLRIMRVMFWKLH